MAKLKNINGELLFDLDVSYKEKSTGLKWVDGKEIFTKSFDIPAMGVGVTHRFDCSDLKIDKCIIDERNSFVSYFGLSYLPVNYTVPNTPSRAIRTFYRYETHELEINTGSELTCDYGVVTIIYTKK